MTKSKKITILTVCLNSADTIKETMNSVLSQKTDVVEYIIIDGGSIDGTQNIVKSYGDKVDVFVSEPDKGISDAFNKGISLSHGEIIGIINSDDALLPNTIYKVLSVFENNPNIDVIHGDVLLYNKDKFLKRLKPPRRWWYPWRLVLFNHPATFVKSYIYKKHGLFNLNYKVAMDVELFLRWKRAGVNIFYLPEPLAKMTRGGISGKNYIEGYREAKKAFLDNGYSPIGVNLLFVIKLLVHKIAELEIRLIRRGLV